MSEPRRTSAGEAFVRATQEAIRASGDDLAAAGFEPPQTVEYWEYLAGIVEVPFETIRSGNFTYADVYAVAMAWVDRQKMRARLSGETGFGGTTRPSSPVSFTPIAEPGTDESPASALTPSELRVLQAPARFDPSELASVARIEVAMEPSQRVSKRSIVGIVRRIIELDMASAPGASGAAFA